MEALRAYGENRKSQNATEVASKISSKVAEATKAKMAAAEKDADTKIAAFRQAAQALATPPTGSDRVANLQQSLKAAEQAETAGDDAKKAVDYYHELSRKQVHEMRERFSEARRAEKKSAKDLKRNAT